MATYAWNAVINVFNDHLTLYTSSEFDSYLIKEKFNQYGLSVVSIVGSLGCIQIHYTPVFEGNSLAEEVKEVLISCGYSLVKINEL